MCKNIILIFVQKIFYKVQKKKIRKIRKKKKIIKNYKKMVNSLQIISRKRTWQNHMKIYLNYYDQNYDDINYLIVNMFLSNDYIWIY